MRQWQFVKNVINVKNNWLTLIGEHWLDDKKELLEYWRVERSNSLILIVIWQGYLVLPCSQFRVGVGLTTLDLAGGRFVKGGDFNRTALSILNKELKLNTSDINTLEPLNNIGWYVDSSFSDQLLFSGIATIKNSWSPSSSDDVVLYKISDESINILLDKLHCLQCRAAILNWWLNLKNNLK